MTERRTEPNDSHSYGGIWLRHRTARLIRSGFGYYESVLDADIEALRAEKELVEIIDDIETLPVFQERQRVAEIGEYLDRKLGASERNLTLSLSHGYVRLTKSVALLYIEHLRRRRQVLAERPGASTRLVASVDASLAALEESMSSGVFRDASTMPLLVEQALISRPRLEPQHAAPEPQHAALVAQAPILLPSIELLDAELRGRCVDLFSNFMGAGQHDRLDTVLTEATRILEDRIRRLSGAPETTIGTELATYAFGAPAHRIRVSAIAAEQEAAHLMFRGLFGFIRNHVHHRLTGELLPQRVLQILGMIDYLLSLSVGMDVDAASK